jgi:hypothetical protein
MTTQRLRSIRIGRLRWVDRVNLLTLVVGVLGAFFILRGDVVVLFLLPVIAALGLDGVLRSHPAARFRGGAATAQQLVCPVAFAVAAPMFFRYVSSGYWGFLAAIVAGLAFGLTAYAAYFTLDSDTAAGSSARLVLLAAAYAGVFGFLSAFYAHDFALPLAAGIAWLVASLFAIEVFRDAELGLFDAVVYSLVAGLVLAQVRWAAAFVRIDGLLAAMLLLLVFYVTTGIALSAITHRLDRRVAMEFVVVGVLGLVIVVIGRLVTSS